MTERVEVRQPATVIFDLLPLEQVVAGNQEDVGSRSVLVDWPWLPLGGRCFGRNLPRQRDRGPSLDERGRAPAHLWGNEVQGAAFVVFAPPPPVRQLRHPLVELRFRHAAGICRARPGAL